MSAVLVVYITRYELNQSENPSKYCTAQLKCPEILQDSRIEGAKAPRNHFCGLELFGTAQTSRFSIGHMSRSAFAIKKDEGNRSLVTALVSVVLSQDGVPGGSSDTVKNLKKVRCH